MLDHGPIKLLVDLDQVTATRGQMELRVPTTLRFVEMPRTGWLFPRPAHLRALLPAEIAPTGTTPESVSLFPTVVDGRDRSRHLTACLDALIVPFVLAQFLRMKPTFVVTLTPALQQRLGGHGKAVIAAALAPISLGTTFVEP